MSAPLARLQDRFQAFAQLPIDPCREGEQGGTDRDLDSALGIGAEQDRLFVEDALMLKTLNLTRAAIDAVLDGRDVRALVRR